MVDNARVNLPGNVRRVCNEIRTGPAKKGWVV
jgi:hypothetical protein